MLPRNFGPGARGTGIESDSVSIQPAIELKVAGKVVGEEYSDMAYSAYEKPAPECSVERTEPTPGVSVRDALDPIIPRGNPALRLLHS